MPDFRVRFVGDLGNLAQFDRAVQNSLTTAARELEAANLKIAQSAGVGNIQPLTKDSGAGRFLRNAKTEIDAVNRTFVQSGQIIRRYVDDYETVITKAEDGSRRIQRLPVYGEQYLADFKKITGNYDTFLSLQKETAGTEAQIARARASYNAKLEESLNRQLAIEERIHAKRAEAGAIAGSVVVGNPVLEKLFGENTHANDIVPFTYEKAIKDAQDKIKSIEAGALTIVPPILGKNIPESLTRFQGEQYTSSIQKRLDILKKNGGQGIGSITQFLSEDQVGLQAEIAALENILAKIPENIEFSKQALVKELKGYEEGLANETAHIAQEIATLQAELERLQGVGPGGKVVPSTKWVDAAGAAKLEARIAALKASNPAYAQLEGVTNTNPPINAALQRTLEESKALRKQLISGGLGGGARYDLAPNSQFAKNLADQGAAVTRYVKDLRTGVTQIQGSVKLFNQATGAFDIEHGFTANIDKNGKVITRWGGQLSGAGSILRQTVRDFQKVIEWTVATTAVFGALGLAISSLKTINDLNTALTRFSITAQLSVGDARDVFKDLGQVAINTATPLVDLIKVADDIALATKTAGDSTEQWKQKIIDLTTAVGIFTNLTGEDTVQGADKLSSAFKQLAIAPKDLIGVLNKVTAVAGGQSTAINEIVTALGGVGEAGKAAGLNLDQQIALVQVLGQVTNKSAADVATAFKNLFGAVSSPGSEKILKEFGISIRDASGGLKPFLDIYREINKALEDGIIPANRYQDVLRGISGGPRRAPDAAALLGNLPAVETAIQRAAGASNEALIANAKVLDTNAAKIQQLQNAFDIAVFEKFGAAVQRATVGITDLLTAVLNLFSKIDPSLVSLLLTLGAITVAAKGLSLIGLKLGPALAGVFTGFRKNIAYAISDIKQFVLANAGAQAVASGQLGFNSAGQLINPKTGKFAKPEVGLGNIVAGTTGGLLTKGATAFKNLGPVKGIAGLGIAALGVDAFTTALASNNQETKQSIGQLLQLAGSVGLMTGLFTPLSIAAIAGGTALQIFGNDAQDTAAQAHDASVAVYEAIQQLKTAREDVGTAEKAQASAKAQLDALVNSGKKDAETKQLQIQATDTFVTATLALADANKKASDSYDALLGKIDGLGDKYSKFKNIVSNSRGATQEQIDSVSQDLAKEILKIQGQGSFNLAPISTDIKGLPLTASPNAPSLYDQGHTYIDAAAQFKQELLKPENLSKLFDLNKGGALTPLGKQIPLSEENIALLSASLQDIIQGKVKLDLNPDQVDLLVKAGYDFVAASSTIHAVESLSASVSAQVQSLKSIGALRGPEAVNAQNRADIIDQLKTFFNNAGQAATGPEGPTPGATGQFVGVDQKQLITLINQLAAGAGKGVGIGDDQLKLIAADLLKLKGIFPELQAEGDLALRQGLARQLIDMGVDVDRVNKLFGLLPDQIQQSTEEMQRLKDLADSFDKASESALNKYAQRNAALQQSANSGDFDKNAKGLAALRAQSEAAYKSEIKLIGAFKALATGSNEDQAAFAAIQKELTGVVGLENAAIIPADQLAGTLIDQAIAAGLSSTAIQKLQRDLAKLLILGDLLSRVKAEFHLKAVVDTKDAIRQLEALFKATVAFAASGPANRGMAEYLHSLRVAIDELKNVQSQAGGDIKSPSNIINDINNLLKSGKGSQLGQLSKTGTTTTKASGPDVSTLDLPAEIANASNRDALIQQAIKMAKQLQSKIPGATKDAKNDIVELLKGTQRILEVRGVKDDYLRKALEELAAIEKKRLDFETKADQISRIRVGTGTFAAIANVPVNSTSGVSLGSPNGPINITLNLNGTVLTPAQLAQFADLVAAALKKQIANG